MNSRQLIQAMRRLLICGALLAAAQAAQAVSISAVTNVNVTPSGFGVFFRMSGPATPAIEVYADAAGTNSLNGKVGVVLYPLNSGDPAATEDYTRRASLARIRAALDANALGYFGVTDCAPNTMYYFRVRAVPSAGAPAVWPASGLAGVRTAMRGGFPQDARQLIVDVAASDAVGYIGLLSNTRALSPLAAAAGDGAQASQLYFNLSDLFDAATGLALAPTGEENFRLTVYGPPATGAVERAYSLTFTTNFAVATSEQIMMAAQYFYLAVGRTNIVAGSGSANVPVLIASGPLLNKIDFTLAIPGADLAGLSVTPADASVGAATLTPLGGERYKISLTAAAGQTYATGLAGSTAVQLNFRSDTAPGETRLIPLTVSGLAYEDKTGVQGTTGTLADGRVLLMVDRKPLLFDIEAMTEPKNLGFYGIPGQTYVVEYCTNLVTKTAWRELQRVTLGNSDVLQTVTITNLPGRSAFVRIRQP